MNTWALQKDGAMFEFSTCQLESHLTSLSLIFLACERGAQLNTH